MVQQDVADGSKDPSKKKISTKEKEKSKAKDKPPTKVIVRRLPPTMNEETFLDQIAPIPENDYFYYVRGEYHVGVPTFSRAYINFINQDDIFHFQEKFDGYVFLDQAGNEYPAVVEFAPFQKVPRNLETGGKDEKCNTLDNDSHYLDFLKKLENPEEVILPSAESYLEQIEQREREMKANGSSKIITPLVEYIQQRRLDREKYREEKKEERRRKELEKKKLRDLERSKKREAKKDEKKQERSQTKVKKEDEKSATPIKVLKNVEREQTEKTEKNESSPAQPSKKLKETTKSKSEKTKEKPAKEKSKLKLASGASQSDKKLTSELPEEAKSEEQLGSKATVTKNEDKIMVTEAENDRATDSKTDDVKLDSKKTETEGEKEKKIRNKDRPAIQIYRPGAKRLSTQKEKDEPTHSAAPSAQATTVKREVKSRTFSRSANKEST